MVMFVISIVMTIIMCSYYFDMGERFSESTKHESGNTWYSFDLITDNYSRIVNSLTTVVGCNNMIKYYDAVSSMNDTSFISVHNPTIYVSEDDIKQRIGDESYHNFIVDNRDSQIVDMEEYGKVSSFEMKCAQMNLNAYNYFGLRVQEGEGFTEEVMKVLDVRRFEVAVIAPKELPNGATYVGTIHELAMDIYTYNEWYLDNWTNKSKPEDKPLLPTNVVALLSTEANYSMYYGAVGVTDEAGKTIEVVEGTRIPEQWVERRPPRRFLQINSAPLCVPHEVDSWFIAIVC